MPLHNQREEELHKAIQQSLKEPQIQRKELTVAQTMEILLRNYSEKDPHALKKLCMEYEGRGAELEKYLETNFKNIPTKHQAWLDNKAKLIKSKALEKTIEILVRSFTEKDPKALSKLCKKFETNFKDIPIKNELGQEEMTRLFNEARRIKIKVVHQRLKFPDSTVSYTLTFHKWLMKRRRSWKKVAGKKNGPTGFFEFSYKGKLIKDDDTPLSLEMGDENVIQAETVVEVTKVLPKREFDEDDPLADGFRKAEAQFLKMQADGFHMNLCIESVDIVKNKFLQEQFDERRAELNRTEKGGNVKSLLLFHGTPQQNTMSILRDNFDLQKRVNGRKFGDGVYFSEQPEVSIGYTGTGFNIAGKWVGKKPTIPIVPKATQNPQNPPKNAPIPSVPSFLPSFLGTFLKQSLPSQSTQNPPPNAPIPPPFTQTEAEAARPSLILCQVLMGANVREVFQKPGEARCWAIVVPNVDQILPRFVLHLKSKK